MIKRNHKTVEAARKELVDNGYIVAHSSPGRPKLWLERKGRGKRQNRYAIGKETRDRSEVWHIVDYPEPSVCLPCELDEQPSAESQIDLDNWMED